ncbi:MAG: RNA methyltransferase [Chloroflexota bacterium]|nr:RNA methyltransferase [Chloroflexota bacterium]
MHRRKARREQGAFLVEGVRLVRDAIAASAAIRQIVLCPELLGERADTLRGETELTIGDGAILTVSASVMRSLSDTETPQGAIAVTDLPNVPMPHFDPLTGFALVLDGVRDPGNVGTLIRAAAAVGCDAVVTIAGSADAFAPKVVRAAMGAHFRLPVIADVDWNAVGSALADMPSVYGADAGASLQYDAVDWRRGCAVIVGNEDRGLSDDARRWSKGAVSIPMERGVESLNAAVSGAILLYEVVRQRRNARTT